MKKGLTILHKLCIMFEDNNLIVVCFIRKSGGVALCLEHISLTEEKEKKTMASETE